ncbi:MAG: peptide ABC transporter substrate-binding protein [Nibricoccus sp.]
MRLAPFLALSLVVAATSVCFAKRETPVEQAAQSKRLLLGNGAEPRDLDPHLVIAYTDYNILVSLFEGLTVIDEATSQPLPGMAERWDISDDGLVYTFHLRKDAKWSNGTPVTADDFAFSMERILSPDFASEYAYMLAPIKGAEDYTAGKIKNFADVGVRALDDQTLQLTLGRPTPYLLSLAAHQAWFPVPKATILKFGKAHDRGTRWTRPENFVGNGPFMLAEWEPTVRIVVKKNPNYYDAAQNRLESVVFFPIEDPNSEDRSYRTGQLHVTYSVPVNRVSVYRNQSPSPLRVEALLETNYFRFNVTKPPFNDPRVRRALNIAIDREAIVRAVMQDTRLPAHSFIPPNTAGYNSSAQIKTDFAAARQLLADAGFPGGKGFPKIEIQYSTPVVDPRVIEAIQEMWRRELGVDVALAQLEYRVHIDNQHILAYQISASRWIGDYNDPSTFTDLMTSQSGNNDTGWKNPSYDKLINEAAAQRDQTKRFVTLQSAEKLIIDEAPVAPLFFGTRTYLIRPEVKGWVPTLLGIHRYQKLSIEP